MTLRLWILIVAATLSSQAKAVDAVCNYAVFYTPGTAGQGVTGAYTEAIWQINPASLHYRKNDNGQLVSQVLTDLVYRNEKGIIHEEHYLLKTDPAAPGAAAALKILDIQRTTLPYGKVTMELKLSEPEVKGAVPFTFTDNFTVVPPNDSPCYSTLQFIDTFINIKKESAFYKNGRQQIPMPTNFVDDNRKTIHYYTELYQINKIPKDAFPIVQRIFISRKAQDNVLSGLQRKDTITATGFLPTTGDFSMEHLGSGNYYLNTELTDKNKNVLATSSNFFQLVNKHPVALPGILDTATGPITYTNLNKTFIAKFTLPQLKAIMKMLLPVSDPVQGKAIAGFIDRPDDTYMRYFIYNFFTEQNSKDPEKAWEAYADRVREVNRMFGTANTMGYESLRGFYYLKYGKPDDIITVPNEPNALPYEIWQYYALGKQSQEGIFLFYQPGSAVSDYKLLTTTVNGELKDPNWRSVLFSNGAASSNSRAEQIMRGR